MADLDLQEEDDNIMDFVNLTLTKTIAIDSYYGKLYRDRFDDSRYYLIVENPIPLCLTVTSSAIGAETAAEIYLTEKARDIISFWTDIKNGVFET